MPNLPENMLVQACTAWIAKQIESTIPSINEALADAVRGASTTTQFADKCYIGELPNADEPRICVDVSGGGPAEQAATMGYKKVTLTYRIMTLIPVAGDLTAMNYEAARQASLSQTLAWLDDDSIALSPTVSIASLPDASAKALLGTRGAWASIWPMKMADGLTVVRGWSVPYTLQFTVQYGQVLDAA